MEKKDLVFPELSYKIIGCAYDVFNSIGGGHKEIVYQRAMALSLKGKGLAFTEQFYYPVKFNDITVGKNFFDFNIDEKIVVELKSANRFTKPHYDQVLNYLHVSGVKLALLISFGSEEVRCKRVVNFKTVNSVPQ
ncbi:MAG TPA: GxxExxY protein [Bacteroidia bacterium]